MKDAQPAISRDTRGAVYVEFLIAFLPFLVLFLSLWQISILYTVKLMVDHAALTAARAGAVVAAENPKIIGAAASDKVNNLTTYREKLIVSSARLALAPMIIDGTIEDVQVIFPDKRAGTTDIRGKDLPAMSGNNVTMFRARVDATMNCKIAFANLMMCGGLTNIVRRTLHLRPVVHVVSEAIFPYQGASYAYDPSDG